VPKFHCKSQFVPGSGAVTEKALSRTCDLYIRSPQDIISDRLLPPAPTPPSASTTRACYHSFLAFRHVRRLSDPTMLLSVIKRTASQPTFTLPHTAKMDNQSINQPINQSTQ